ncbi:hypothetical protein [Luteimonas arsenica]|uniref:hypothetical protein n=1 Tax=Luteimonas arsenica TaxID=1586242 RepID=UPI0010564A1C|nr:hypothetical protein [Luteimonas arsenica]
MSAAITEASLVEIGDAIRNQLHALANRPDADYAADVAVNLNGARRAVLRLRESLMQEANDAGAG